MGRDITSAAARELQLKAAAARHRNAEDRWARRMIATWDRLEEAVAKLEGLVQRQDELISTERRES